MLISKMKKLFFLFFLSNMAHSQFVANYDEAKVPAYILPDILQSVSGKKIKTSKDWEKNRGNLLNLFSENMFGITPNLNLKRHFRRGFF